MSTQEIHSLNARVERLTRIGEKQGNLISQLVGNVEQEYQASNRLSEIALMVAVTAFLTSLGCAGIVGFFLI